MFNSIKFNASHSQRTSALVVILFAVVMVLLPISAGAQCTQWDASGEWKIEVKSGPRKGYVGNASLKQAGTRLSGKLTDGGISVGTVDNGSSDGNTFNLYVLWSSKDAEGSHVEIYVGTIGSNGMIEGTATIFGDRTLKAAWSSDRSMKCIAGSIKQSAPGGYGAVTSVPGILSYIKPGQPPGTKTLSWDAGPDHPYAEVWVKVGDGDEAFVVEKGKGKRQVTVEPGKTYLYILTDAGKRLATVIVKSQ